VARQIKAVVNPVLDTGKAAKMTQQLSGAMVKAANTFNASLNRSMMKTVKAFGAGLKTTAAGAFIGIGQSLLGSLSGALTGATLGGFYDKASNKFNSTLDEADLIATLAGQFGSKDAAVMPAEMKRLMNVFGAVGLTNDHLVRVLTNIQTMVGSEKAKPGSTMLGGGFKDTDNAFQVLLQVIESLQKTNAVDSDKAMMLASELFGERLAGKSMELLQTPLMELSKKFAMTPQQIKDFNALVNQYAETEAKQKVDRLNAQTQDFLMTMEQNDPNSKLAAQQGVEQKERQQERKALENMETIAAEKMRNIALETAKITAGTVVIESAKGIIESIKNLFSESDEAKAEKKKAYDIETEKQVERLRAKGKTDAEIQTFLQDRAGQFEMGVGAYNLKKQQETIAEKNKDSDAAEAINKGVKIVVEAISKLRKPPDNRDKVGD
jgi:hypothetical protein